MRLSTLISLFTVLSVITLISACDKKNPKSCEDKVCLNGGNCDLGVCQCPSGTSGDSCQLLDRENVIGKYNAVHTSAYCSTAPYEVEIQVSNRGLNFVNVINFGGYGDTVFATVTTNYGGYSINIPNQVSGVTSYSGNIGLGVESLTGTYTVTAENQISSCNGTITLK